MPAGQYTLLADGQVATEVVADDVAAVKTQSQRCGPSAERRTLWGVGALKQEAGLMLFLGVWLAVGAQAFFP